ncbi:MAG: HD family hydrolase [Infirmifilum sp.]
MNTWSTLEAAKWLTRTGWMLRGIPGSFAETVSQHSWETGIIAFIIADRASKKGVKVNPYRAATIGLLHDLLEGVVGDIPKYTSRLIGELKKSFEKTALEELQLDASLKQVIVEWLQGDTVESRIARIADALSTYVQAIRYVSIGYRKAEEIANTSRQKALEEAENLTFKDVILDLINEIEKQNS